MMSQVYLEMLRSFAQPSFQSYLEQMVGELNDYIDILRIN
ncbi:unnamed protein product [Paramecium octaurelia]|uniref:Uncharacterized protein n=1 Tax=Paramecium octaurelia TaxID=43137 RepID=A0A8S1YMT3_PAROT|nr:unnamed protein product [Paramecium octaurelia]